MKFIGLSLPVVLLLGWGIGFLSGASGTELAEAEFRKLHTELQPDDSAPWRQIPWKISVLDGQRAAATGSKPIFIWAMDGHPLACT